MMATTPIYALPYQTATDPPDGAALGEVLAEAVEAELSRIDTDVAGAQADISTLQGQMTVQMGPPVAQLRRAATLGTPIPNGGSVFTPIPFDVEDDDTHNGHDNAVNPSRWYTPAGWGGRYRVSGGMGFLTAAAGRRWAVLAKNGVAIPGTRDNRNPVSGAVTLLVCRPVIVRLLPGDYLELLVFQDSGAVLNIAIGSEDQATLSVEWIRP